MGCLTFPTPAAVVAGQTYYIEIQGSVWYGDSLSSLYFGDGTPYANGEGFQKYAGSWQKINTSLAFRSYVDNQVDVTISPANNLQFNMSGAASQRLNMSLYKPTAPAAWQYGATIDSAAGSFTLGYQYGYLYNGDDLTMYWDVASGVTDYYDQDGWITVRVDNSSTDWIYPPTTNLVTDQFSLTFSRTYTATADANGAYSFPSLPDGNYALTITQPSYVTASTSGALLAGQLLSVPLSLAKAPPGSLQGLVRLWTGLRLEGVIVTVTDQLGIRSGITDVNGNYTISGIVHGPYSVSFTGSQLQTKIVTGSLSPGQIGTENILMSAAEVVITITSPTNGSLVYTNPLIVTGTVQNAGSITVTVNSIDYTAAVVNDAFAVSIPLASGPATLICTGESTYTTQASKTLTITRTPFILKNLGDSGNVSIMEVDGNYDAKNLNGTTNDQPRKSIATEYFKSHVDTDFLVFLSTFDYAMPEATSQGFYTPVRNDVQGINQTIFNNTTQFGSAGKLQGTIDLGNVTALAGNSYGPKLDETITIMNHELMHRFGSYVRYKNPDGTLNTALLGKDSAHWSYLLDTKGSLMYGSGWKNNGDGTFTATAKQSSYSPLDLYLMGMIPKEQVPPMLLIENAAIDKTQLPQLGATITGTPKTVTIDDIIATEGARIPDATTAQKQFNVGFVLLTRAGNDATAATQAIETLRKAWAGRFAELTQGKGSVANVPASLAVTIDSPADGATIIGPDVTVSGTVIITSEAETGVTVNGTSAAISGNRFIVNHVPLQIGSNSVVITATDTNALSATVTKSVTSQAGNYIRLVSNIDTGTAPLNLSFHLNGSFTPSTPTITTNGPVSLALTPGASTTEFSAQLSIEGIYTISVSAVGPDGLTYTDSITITVINRNQLENLLKAKWDGIKARITAMDVGGAVANFAKSQQANIRELYTAFGTSLPLVANELTSIDLVNISDNIAECRMMRSEEYSGQIIQFEYPIYFVREDGIWKFQSL
jgi:hypothetical protein